MCICDFGQKYCHYSSPFVCVLRNLMPIKKGKNKNIYKNWSEWEHCAVAWPLMMISWCKCEISSQSADYTRSIEFFSPFYYESFRVTCVSWSSLAFFIAAQINGCYVTFTYFNFFDGFVCAFGGLLLPIDVWQMVTLALRSNESNKVIDILKSLNCFTTYFRQFIHMHVCVIRLRTIFMSINHWWYVIRPQT